MIYSLLRLILQSQEAACLKINIPEIKTLVFDAQQISAEVEIDNDRLENVRAFCIGLPGQSNHLRQRLYCRNQEANVKGDKGRGYGRFQHDVEQ